jgi:hypothetical protein
MKAMIRDTYRSPDRLELSDVDTPHVGPDDVLLRVHAAGVDQGAWHIVTGLPYPIRLAGFGLRRPRPASQAGRSPGGSRRSARTSPGSSPATRCSGYARALRRVRPRPREGGCRRSRRT